MKQTAVEWLYHELDDILQLYSHEWDAYKIAIQKAKEMEKEQMIDFTMGFMGEDNTCESYRRESAFDFFDKTFNTNEK